MDTNIEKLREEIAELEKLMEKDHFGGLFDRARQDKNYNRLKKLRKELKKLEGESKKKSNKK